MLKASADEPGENWEARRGTAQKRSDKRCTKERNKRPSSIDVEVATCVMTTCAGACASGNISD
eukprot:6172453-Pleurochrysis_carterae.AAC.1